MRLLQVGLSLVLLSLVGCTEKTPDRKQIPVIKERLFALQEAVRGRNPAAVDSLLSVQILDIGQSSDSLLKVAWGEDGTFPFRQFALDGVIYKDDKARVECHIVDTLGRKHAPVVFTFVHEHKLWLLKRFELEPHWQDTTTAAEP